MIETERSSPRFVELDAWPTRDALDALYEGQLAAVAAVGATLPMLSLAVDAAAARIGATGRLIYVGAGTSGRIAVQDGAELPPTFNWPFERLVFLIAGGDAALTRSVEGAEDDQAAARTRLAAADPGPADVVLALAASGTTPFTIAAVAAARHAGALTVGIANNPGAPLLAAAEHPIVAATGAEVLAGSTRMKAGTAQKAILNLFSTALMLKLGHVYRGRMVDLAARNAKLDTRARAMVADLAGCDEATAAAALAACGGRVKPAILVAGGLTAEAANRHLAAHGDNLRAVLTGLRPKPAH